MKDACNWTPVPQRENTSPPASNAVACGRTCAQHWDMIVAGQRIRMHRCADHKVSEDFISRLQGAEHR